MISTVSAVPLFKNRDILSELYTDKKLSARQIAKQLTSSHSTIIEHLRNFKIPIREDQVQVHKQPGRGLAFGKIARQGQLLNNRKEQSVIELMLALREDGLSYRKIADFLDNRGIPTKTGRSNWKAASVMKIIKAAQTRLESEAQQA